MRAAFKWPKRASALPWLHVAVATWLAVMIIKIEQNTAKVVSVQLCPPPVSAPIRAVPPRRSRTRGLPPPRGTVELSIPKNWRVILARSTK